MVIEESPRTAMTPGLGKDVEHSEHVGVKLLGRRLAHVRRNHFVPCSRSELFTLGVDQRWYIHRDRGSQLEWS